MARTSAVVLLFIGLTGSVSADVADKSAAGFTIKSSVPVAATPQRIYAALLNVGAWWDQAHTYSGDAKNMTLAAQPGGCFCEKFAGGSVEHGRVVNVAANRMVRISAALGPLQALAVTGSLTWTIEPAKQGSGSTLSMTYAVGGYAPGGLDKLADVVDSVVTEQVKRLKAFAEKNP